MYQKIEKHGQNLLAVFPEATEQDPISLCKKLRLREIKAHIAAEKWCNGEIEESQYNQVESLTLAGLHKLLGQPKDKNVKVFVNSDPRGYALKIENPPESFRERDWGGYGIIAPSFFA